MHRHVWHSPQPLWTRALNDPVPYTRFRRPAILRFATDTFMDDLQEHLRLDPSAIESLVARVESWRSEQAGWDTAAGYDDVIKLYQPVHQRFYLVTSSLVCQVRGLPDKEVDTSSQESVSFVLRRLPVNKDGTVLPEDTPGYGEYGWFGDAGWKPVRGPRRVDRTSIPTKGSADVDPSQIEREERLPLFPLSFTETVSGLSRRLIAGLVPVAKRETYETAPRHDVDPPLMDDKDPLRDARLGQYDARVVWSLRTLLEPLRSSPPAILSPENVREPFAFALLDLVDFLQRYLPKVWLAIERDDNSGGLSNKENEVLNAIARLNLHNISWRVLRAIDQERELLQSGQIDFSAATLPGRGLNPLVRLTKTEIRSLIEHLDVSDDTYLDPSSDCSASSLNCCIRNALPSDQSVVTDEPFANPEVAGKIGGDVGAVYAIRCVYERPRCKRNRHYPLVSERTRPFQLAGFFDDDAPVRPTRIALPVDTSVAGLRAFPKSVSFLISDKLRAQLDRIQAVKLEALDKGEIGEEGQNTLGMICSLSIPIITICAFILLLVIVFVLNIVFWWVPFFRICFSIPLKK